LNGRRERRDGDPHAISLQSSGGISTPSVGATVEIDVRPVTRASGRTDSRARSTLPARSSARARASRARCRRTRPPVTERLAVRLGRLVEEQRPRVVWRVGNRRLDDTRAERIESRGRTAWRSGFSAGGCPPTDGGRVSKPIVSPSRRASGTASPVEHRPHQRDVCDARRHRSDRVIARTEREHALRRDAAPLGLEPDDVCSTQPGGGSNSPCRCRSRCRRARRQRCGVPARRAAGRAARMPRVAHRGRTTGSGSSRPTRTRAGSPCRRSRRPRRRAAARRARCASAHGRRRFFEPYVVRIPSVSKRFLHEQAACRATGPAVRPRARLGDHGVPGVGHGMSATGLDLELRARNRERAHLDERARRPHVAEHLFPHRVDARAVADVDQVDGHFTTSANVAPPLRAPHRCSRIPGAPARRPSPPTSRPSTSTGTQPETKRRLPARTASV